MNQEHQSNQLMMPNWSEAALQPGAKRTLIPNELIDLPHDLSHVTAKHVGYLGVASASHAVLAPC